MRSECLYILDNILYDEIRLLSLFQMTYDSKIKILDDKNNFNFTINLELNSIVLCNNEMFKH